MEKFPFYYEVETCEDSQCDAMHEGGFLMAEDHADAIAQIAKLYEPGLKSVHIEYMNVELFVFSIENARRAKEWVNEHGAY